LRVDLQNFGSGPKEFSAEQCDCSGLYSLEEPVIEEPVSGAFFVQPNGGNEFILEGTLAGRQKLTCVRSLEEFFEPFEVKFRILIRKLAGVKKQVMDDGDEDLFRIDVNPSQKTLDLSECLRQLILLEQPINPVKEPEKDFQWEEQRPGKHEVDPRWAKLEALKKSMKQKD
jgi:uncharacterized protein